MVTVKMHEARIGSRDLNKSIKVSVAMALDLIASSRPQKASKVHVDPCRDRTRQKRQKDTHSAYYGIGTA
jgi:hypothetical protein